MCNFLQHFGCKINERRRHQQPPQHGIHLISYADDCTIASSGVNVEDITIRINGYLNQLISPSSKLDLKLGIVASERSKVQACVN
uniref:Reverse transcriptase domain-containing protein n=1 Tax=Megaselia scalaris TaxID=36166 RepID=T1GV48_MEGSC